MNQNQKNYLMTKLYEIQFLLEEKEEEKKEMSAGFTEMIKSHKRKITRLMHAIRGENEDYLVDMMDSEEFKKFEKIV